MDYVNGAANEHTNEDKQGLFMTGLAISYCFCGTTKISFLDCLTLHSGRFIVPKRQQRTI